MSFTLPEALVAEITRLLTPINDAVENPHALERLLSHIGVPAPAIDNNALIESLRAVVDLKSRLDELASQPILSLDSVAAALDVSRQALMIVRSLSQPEGSAGALENFGQDLANFLVTSYLARRHPLARSVAALVTLLEPLDELKPRPAVFDGGQLLRGPFVLDRFHLDRLVSLMRDPASTLRAEYGNALATAEDASAMAKKLFPRLQRVLRELGVSCRYGFDPDDEDLLEDAAPFLKHALIIYAADPLNDAPAEAGVVLSLSSADRGDLGLVISPFGTLTSTKHVSGWVIELMLTAGVDILAYGRHGLTLLASEGTAEVGGSLSATLPAPSGGPAFIFGASNGTRMEIGGAQIKLDTSLSEARQSLTLSADVASSKIVIAPGDGDGFLNNILPAEGLEAKFDLGLAWSNERGLTLRGSGGLDATLPVNLSIRDVFKVPTIHIGLRTSDTGLSVEVSATVGLSIGPINAVVERVGVAAAVTFPEDGGNLGVANLDFGFKSPNGVGLSIDKAGVRGGGYLYFDKDKGQYAGVVQLNLQGEISVKGIGLIATRLPDNSKGFSLLVIITAEDFKPIPLPLGFKLTGIGGLLAINRTFDEEVLRAGLKSNTLDSVLFPRDPIRNAPQIISNLNKVFPISKGHHLFGPVAQITWGAKGLLTANLALVMELGERLRLLILAQIAVILPRPENDLIRLKMDAVGVIDFDRGTASLDATLHDSRLLKKFTLTGDMAMRLKWEDGPNFALAVGGLHPAFNPPPNFPKLERVAINLSSGDNPRIRCEAYFALTSNTVQFGARAELYAKALGFSVHGDIGFDVLIQFDPFQFLADFHAQVQLKRGSRNLFKVRLEGELSGPRPLRIKAKATFEVLWMDVSFRVDKTLVSGERPEAPAPVEVMPLLKEALGDPGAWEAKLPAGGRQMVTLRATPGATSDVLLHPLGALMVKQNVVPLNMEISRFGQTTPAGERRFAITDVYLGETRQTAPPTVKDFFARAQYIEMSDGEKLSAPSFEPMTAGVAIGSDEIVIGDDWLEVDAIRFETFVVNKEQNESRRSASGPYELKHEHLEKQSRYGAAGASELRRSGRAKYRGAAPKYRIVKEGWSIAATSNLTEQPSPVVLSYSEAAQALRELKEENPAMAAGLKILRPSELQ
jgi:hypothetical protein